MLKAPSKSATRPGCVVLPVRESGLLVSELSSGSWCSFTSLVGAEANKQLLRIRLQLAVRLGKGDSQPVSKLLCLSNDPFTCVCHTSWRGKRENITGGNVAVK
ncbi:hypothetical protein H101_06882 [Trichophyton interdigitale H6]|nr:hypothetical protein H101_06882 [Trichophyton interdigitale H6]